MPYIVSNVVIFYFHVGKLIDGDALYMLNKDFVELVSLVPQSSTRMKIKAVVEENYRLDQNLNINQWLV